MKRILIIILFIPFFGCKKYLEQRSDKKQVVISSLADLQALLDNADLVNREFGAGESASDNYFASYSDYIAQPEWDRNMYTWNKEKLFSPTSSTTCWSALYDDVYRANTVLGNLPTVSYTPLEQPQWNNLRGQALFLRAKCFLSLAGEFAPAYDAATAATDLGIPLRLDPDFNLPSFRASVAVTYDQIFADLKAAVPCLPVSAVSVTRASQPAAYALLARTYLYMRKYDSCYRYANLSLSQKSGLYDFNSLPLSAQYPFSLVTFDSNPEVLYYSIMFASSIVQAPISKIDSNLYRSYDANDLRKQAYFKANADNTIQFKGSILAGSLSESVCTNDVWLMKAECAARSNDIVTAMDALNTLLRKRWKNNAFIPFTAANATDALSLILTERRKELVMTDTRWMDIKRLNKEGANITLRRLLNGITYTLPPNDLRYAMAIPEDIITLTGMPQNPR